MRSPRGFAAALLLLVGVLLAVIVGAMVGEGAENVIHLTLAGCFMLLAFAVFDFNLPTWAKLAACMATGVLAVIFLLQGAADLLQSQMLRHLAYDVLGQRLEKMLGYAFLLWCGGVLLQDSRDWTRTFGAIVLLAILAIESYGLALSYFGGAAPDALKLLYLPLFVWLMLESARAPAPDEVCSATQRQP